MSTELIFPLDGKRIWVAGHPGMVGSAIARRLASEGCKVILAGREVVDLKAGISDAYQWFISTVQRMV